MLDGYQIFDADAHTMMSPNMWTDLPEDLAARRPRAVRISDESGLGYWNTGWYVDGRLNRIRLAQAPSLPILRRWYSMSLSRRRENPERPSAPRNFPSLASLDLSDPMRD
jgi:hypothetical protein